MTHYILFPLLFTCLAGLLLPGKSLHAENNQDVAGDTRQVLIEIPPESLANWYKPDNKRQVWLHTMFRLRQALQAVEIYVERDDKERLVQWASILHETYATVPDMVPQWRDASRQHLAADILAFAKTAEYQKLYDRIEQLQKACNDCHQKWQAPVTAIYRSPDYHKLKVKTVQGDQSFIDFMHRVANTLGILKIAREDGELETARKATKTLARQFEELGTTCATCHKEAQSKERILGKTTFETLALLENALTEPHDPKVSGQHLGTIGFSVCGRCHGVHRTLGMLRSQILAQ